jgi:hypothetical protein
VLAQSADGDLYFVGRSPSGSVRSCSSTSWPAARRFAGLFGLLRARIDEERARCGT